ncbi:MAG TPA: iron-sulfur cluster assembly scaffold protein [Gemmatimonadaceae bacterium]|jgi:nitrogen fixation NifU-like protein
MDQGLPYGSAITEHFRRPRNYGSLPNASAEAEGVNPLCGDRVRVAIRLDAGTIVDARFTANACAICIAAASLLTERLPGMSSAAASRLSDDDALALLQSSVPAARRRCATLPLEALHRALTLSVQDIEQLPST